MQTFDCVCVHVLVICVFVRTNRDHITYASGWISKKKKFVFSFILLLVSCRNNWAIVIFAIDFEKRRRKYMRPSIIRENKIDQQLEFIPIECHCNTWQNTKPKTRKYGERGKKEEKKRTRKQHSTHARAQHKINTNDYVCMLTNGN